VLRFELSVELLGRTRFAYSPLAETVASLHVLTGCGPAFPHERWKREVAAPLAGTDLSLPGAMYPAGRWAPSFLFVPMSGPQSSIHDQLDQLVETPLGTIAEDLQQIWQGREMPPVARAMLAAGRRGVQRLADDLRRYWHLAVEPYWSRVAAALERDVAYRTTRLMSGGLLGLFDDLHPQTSVRDRALLVDKPLHADTTYRSAHLTLVPSVFGMPHLLVDASDERTTLIYGARGVARVWEGGDAEPVADRLGDLIGHTRARVLRNLQHGASTTSLAQQFGQSPATISAHLSVLRDTGLVSSCREGRRVVYRQTELGATIVAGTGSSRYRTVTGA
jgi:DNA-binding transcriptional ArsR family regulator